MEFEYGEDEILFYQGVIEALKYYRTLESLGFKLDDDIYYYVDFSGYGIGQGYQYDGFDNIVESIVSPFVGAGYVINAFTSLGEELSFFKANGFIPIGDESNYNYLMISLRHPIILNYLSDDSNIKEVSSIINHYVQDSDVYDGLDDEKDYEWSFVDKTGIYLCVKEETICYSTYFQELILPLLTKMTKYNATKKEVIN